MLDLSAFGKNDIRGIYKNEITEELFYFTGKAFVRYIRDKKSLSNENIWITVCRDARTHSPALSKALIDGILSTGANVIDLGLAPTPIGYYSEVVGVPKYLTNNTPVSGAMIITASHNPSQYNGMKITFKKQSLNEEQLKEIKILTENEYNFQTPPVKNGKLISYDIIHDYINDMQNKFLTLPKLTNGNVKVVVDSGNATGGIVAPQLYRNLGCQVIELFSTPDGRFPNHHPNPSEPKNLEDLKRRVKIEDADFGIAFDGDSDRIGVVDSDGNHLTGDKLLLIYALDLIKNPKTTQTPVIVSEVKCSQVLFDTIDKSGGKSVMCKTGHGYIKSKMKETDAVLAGEMSGHTFFKDRYYGFDDAVYAGCRIIEIFAKNKAKNPDFKIKDLLTPFDKIYSSPEVRFSCPNQLKKTILEKFEEFINQNKDAFGDEIKDIITIDGMRIVFDGGFALIRQSNTEPVFTLRFEAKTQEICEKYTNVMISKLEELLNSETVRV